MCLLGQRSAAHPLSASLKLLSPEDLVVLASWDHKKPGLFSLLVLAFIFLDYYCYLERGMPSTQIRHKVGKHICRLTSESMVASSVTAKA